MKVPVLSFGASSLGGVFRSVSEAEAIRAVFTAIEHGMTFSTCRLITVTRKPRRYWEGL